MLNEEGKPAEPCDVEASSVEMVNMFLERSSVVLEIGARYGTVSCAIAKQQSNSGKVLSVEADPRVWDALTGNLARHGCTVNVLKGVIGTEDVTITPAGNGGYGTVSAPVANLLSNVTSPHMTFDEAQSKYNMKFDTVMFDCEGCIPTTLAQNPGMLDNVKVLTLEIHNDAETAAYENLLASGTWKLVHTSPRETRQHVLQRVSL
mmetsp:Transcript_18713/g.32824  ORF Transcript_18713/g.32824 Transcript_18713/m.32824 type:complete len:205 (+) Transcript_18713:110-724(+)